MSGFLERLLSGNYRWLESLWQTEFEKLADEFFGRMDVPAAGLDDEYDETYVEKELNTTIEALQADLRRVESRLAEERSRHEAAKRELCVTKAELKSARYKLSAIEQAMTSRLHGEPIG